MANRRLDAYYQKDDFTDFIERIPLYSPAEMFDLLAKKGYKGQDGARKTVTLFAYRHIRRIKQLYLEGLKRHQLPPKSNTLLVGPTGCGKTFLLELLFREILKIPTVIIDSALQGEDHAAFGSCRQKGLHAPKVRLDGGDEPFREPK